MKTKLDLFVIVWGAPMAHLFSEAGIPSLLQIGNIPLNKKDIHALHIYASKQAHCIIERSEDYRDLRSFVKVIWHDLLKGEGDVNACVKFQMALSAEKGNYMLCVGPDLFLGNGCLDTMMALIKEGRNPILYCFPRVCLQGMNTAVEYLEIKQSVNRWQLVNIAMDYRLSGPFRITGEKPDWTVYHHCPTPCIKPDYDIVELFQTNHTKNAGYDQCLPYYMISKGYPWHLISYSFDYFQIELGTRGIETESDWHTEWRDKGAKFFDKRRLYWQGVEGFYIPQFAPNPLRWLDVLEPKQYLLKPGWDPDLVLEGIKCGCDDCKAGHTITCPWCKVKFVGHGGVPCPNCNTMPEWLDLDELRRVQT